MSAKVTFQAVHAVTIEVPDGAEPIKYMRTEVEGIVNWWRDYNEACWELEMPYDTVELEAKYQAYAAQSKS